MFSSKWTWLVIGVLAGYSLCNRLDTVPVINKIPKL